MSWSMFTFRQHWAHAHDVEQDAFMALAAMYVEADPTWRDVGWLRDWQTFWLESAGQQGNGCSDLRADDFLTDDERVARFREFLRRYRSWLAAVEPVLPVVLDIPTDRLLDFVITIDAVLAGDEDSPAGVRDVDPVEPVLPVGVEMLGALQAGSGRDLRGGDVVGSDPSDNRVVGKVGGCPGDDHGGGLGGYAVTPGGWVEAVEQVQHAAVV
jgi:hypothetical protein